MFTYTASIPQPGDNPAQSQDQILNNFQSINQANNVDNIDFNNATDYGKSKYTHLKNADTPSIAIPTTTADEGVLYTKVVNSDSQLFYRFKSNGVELQMTNNFVNIVGTPGCVPLAGNMLMQWGSYGSAADGTAYTFFTPFTTLYSLQVTGLDPANVNKFVYVKLASATGFTIGIRTTGGASTMSFYYTAIGVK